MSRFGVSDGEEASLVVRQFPADGLFFEHCPDLFRYVNKPLSTTRSTLVGFAMNSTSNRTSLGLRSRSGSANWKLLIGMVALMILGAAGLSRMSSRGDMDRKIETAEATRRDLLVTITEDGDVESASNVEIKCRVAGGSSILWIVDDGSQVKKGDKLVELDSSSLEDQIDTQRIAFEQARTLMLQSEKSWAVAKIAVTEYLEGTFKQLLLDADALITIASENLRTAKNSLNQTEKMFRQGFVSSLDFEGAKFAVERCELELGSAQTARDVLVNFTKEKTLEELRSLRDNAEAQWKSDTTSYELEESRLRRLQEQLSNCTIPAPQDGMVVYANERSRRDPTISIEEGAVLREQQVILRLPDLTQMQVRVTVHESKVDQVRPGMRARIRILDRETTGVVTTIANQPEPSNPFEGNAKEYTTLVKLAQEDSNSFRPGMTAEVEILVAHETNVVTLPVRAVVEQQGSFYAWVETDQGPERRLLLIGLTNDEVVEIKDGVLEGERVVLNPRPFLKGSRERSGKGSVAISKFGAS